MRLRVVHEEDGEIVAAAVVEEESEGLTPVPAEGQTMAEVDVPDDLAGEDLGALCTQLRVDPDGPRLMRRDDSAA